MNLIAIMDKFFFRSLALAVAATVLASAAHAQSAPASGNGSEVEQTFLDYQVDQPVKVKASRAPVYPERLRAAKVDGQVLVQFVVDERGVAQMGTFRVIKSTDAELTDAVRRAVSSTEYYPAEARGHKVRQLVQQPFMFNFNSRKL